MAIAPWDRINHHREINYQSHRQGKEQSRIPLIQQRWERLDCPLFLSKKQMASQFHQMIREHRRCHHTKCSGNISTPSLQQDVMSQLASTSPAQQFVCPESHGVLSSAGEKNGKYHYNNRLTHSFFSLLHSFHCEHKDHFPRN